MPKRDQSTVMVPQDDLDDFIARTFRLITYLGGNVARYSEPKKVFEPLSNDEGSTTITAAINGWLRTADLASGCGRISAAEASQMDLLLDRAHQVVVAPSSDEEPEDPTIERGTQEQPSEPSQEPSQGGTTDPQGPPESFDLGGHQWFREDIDLIEIYEGQTFLTTTKFGTTYHAVVGDPVGPAKGKKGRGKTPARQVSMEEEGKSSPGPSKGPVVGSPPAKSPVASTNPLNVKGEAKSKALSDGERVALRKFFNLREGIIPSADWSRMDNRARALAMKERSIPRWATAAVLKNPANLPLILEGKLVKDNLAEAELGRTIKVEPGSSQALEAWQALKADFKGTTLFREPVTSKEKAFSKRFSQLVADYGQQPCFPKLRERPDRQDSGRPARGSRAPGPGGFGEFLEMAKAMGEIAKAFRP
jgi:hypothetical protein